MDRTPVWLMRQAGRSLPEYRKLREAHGLKELLLTPTLAAEVTLQPIRRFDVDVAMLFSDITLPLHAMGLGIDLDRGDAPRLEPSVSSAADIERLHVIEPREALGEVLEAVRIVRRELDGHRPVLGLASAPFTLACYALDGGPGDLAVTKSLMFGDPSNWHRLCDKLTTVIVEFARAQVEAGAQAVQIFDSWIGALSPDDYRAHVLPYSRRVFTALSDVNVPSIHFGLAPAALLEPMREAGGDVIGLDWRVPLDEAWDVIGPDRGVQGNLDPALLLGPLDRMLAAAGDILDRAAGRRGHIFNLGHGLLPSTPPDRIQSLIRYVHRHSTAGHRS